MKDICGFILQRIALLSVGKTADLTAVMGPRPTAAPTTLILGISSREYWSDLAILMLFPLLSYVFRKYYVIGRGKKF